MKIKITKDLHRIVNMYWDIEKRHWEEEGSNNDNHIFISLNNVRNYILSLKKEEK